MNTCARWNTFPSRALRFCGWKNHSHTHIYMCTYICIELRRCTVGAWYDHVYAKPILINKNGNHSRKMDDVAFGHAVPSPSIYGVHWTEKYKCMCMYVYLRVCISMCEWILVLSTLVAPECIHHGNNNKKLTHPYACAWMYATQMSLIDVVFVVIP